MKTSLPMKLEGKLLKMAQAMTKEKDEAAEQLEAIEKKIDETRVAFWDAVNEEYKDLDRGQNHVAECEYAHLGIVILKEKKREKSDMPEGLKKILAKVLSS